MQALAELVQGADGAIEDVAISIAADEYPFLDRAHLRRELDCLADSLRARVSSAKDNRLKLSRLCDQLYGQRGFRGIDDYDDPSGNHLNHVLKQRRGSPVLMAVLLIALGRRVGVDVEAVAFPGHFLVRAGPAPHLYVDPYDGRHPLPRARLEELARDTLTCDEREASQRLEAVGPRVVAVRILLNLQRIHRARADHARSLVVCDRLVDVTGAPFHRCDRAAHALALGATRAAIADLEAYLAAHPAAPDAARVQGVLDELRGQSLGALN
jgi:regulator of sirC expression with transglutaminase-like and TPR domain